MKTYEVYFKVISLDQSEPTQCETVKRTHTLRDAKRAYGKALKFADEQNRVMDGYRIEEVGIYDETREETIERTDI